MAEPNPWRSLVDEPIAWQRSDDPRFPWRATCRGLALALYDGDWPGEAAYTLYVNGEPVGGLEGWPEAWTRRVP